eukprot:12915476-Prorocentrum_lima.AAC.1
MHGVKARPGAAVGADVLGARARDNGGTSLTVIGVLGNQVRFFWVLGGTDAMDGVKARKGFFASVAFKRTA